MLAIIIFTAVFYLLWVIINQKSKYLDVYGILAWLAHAVICAYSLFDEGGWKLNIVNDILLVSWISVLIVLIFKLRSRWVKVPLVFFVILSLLIIDINPILDYQHYQHFSWQLDLHISLSLLAYSILSVATLYAISLLVHIKKIKNSKFDNSSNLLSIVDEEKKLFQLIALGWLILSTSLISGVIFIEDFMQQHLGHKVVFSILAWLIFGLIILGRITKGWRGEKLISLTIAGMTFLAIGYLGSKIVLEWLI
jgi:ABC-type uncharacterized transport system permease subunit